jgi:hypothetical protein
LTNCIYHWLITLRKAGQLGPLLNRNGASNNDNDTMMQGNNAQEHDTQIDEHYGL